MKDKKLFAWDELSINSEVSKLIPTLLEKGLSIEDASALANNAVFVYFIEKAEHIKSPYNVLEWYSLRDIAQICEKHKNFREPNFSENHEVVNFEY